MRGTPAAHAPELAGPEALATAFPGVAAPGAGPLRAAWLYTPIGGMVAVADDAALHLLEFPNRPILAAQLRRLAGGGLIGIGPTELTALLQQQLTEWFAGRRRDFSVPLAPAGSAFAQACRQALIALPFGAVMTYGAFAASIGHPTAARAVGRANGANPISILVPCHRLTGLRGALTGYGGGLWRKEWLIAHEAAVLRRPTA